MGHELGDITVEPPEPGEVWTYRAMPNPWTDDAIGVVDGDTYRLIVDCGFFSWRPVTVRAMHLDTAETHGVAHDSDEYKTGKEQTEFVRDWMKDAMWCADSTDGVPDNWPFLIRTRLERGAYKRWLAEIFNWRGESLEKAVYDAYGEEYLYSH